MTASQTTSSPSPSPAPTTTHLVIGAGPVGSGIARLLASHGATVTVASRSGRGADIPGATRVGVDAADRDALSALAEGADVIYNAVNPPRYDIWATYWPPVADAIRSAAERSGAVLANVGNLYVYGRPTGRMSETTPVDPGFRNGEVRARMWADDLAAHEAGRLRLVEVRGSDYIGAGCGDNSHATRIARAVVAGRRAQVLGDPDQPHSFTHVGDVARTLVAAAADEGAYGRAWIVPTNPPRTQRELANEFAEVAGVKPVAVSGMPDVLLRAIGIFDGRMTALARSSFMFRTHYEVDDAAARARFGIQPTPWRQLLTETLADVRAERAAGTR